MNEGFDGLQAYKLCCSRRLFTVTQQPKVVFNLYNQLIENYTGLQAPSFEEILDNDSRQWTVAYTQYFQSVQTQIGWVKDQVAEALAQWVYAIRSFQKLCTHQINWNLRSNLMEKFTVFEAGYELRAVNMQPYDAYADPGLIAYNSLFQWQSDLKSATDRTTIQELNTTINDFQTLKYALLNQIFTLIQNEKLDDYCKCADFKRFFDTISSDTPADVQRVYGMNQASIVQKFPAYYDKMTQYCNQQIPLLLLQFNKNYIQSKNCSSKQMKHSKSIEPTSINSLIPLLFENIKKTGDITDDHYLQLYFIYKTLLKDSMMIVDKNLITKYVCKPSGLSFYVVDSSKSGKYFCLPDSYCSCTNFIYSTALKQEGLICKHLLAVKMVDALNKYFTIKEIKDEEYNKMLNTY